ncbi:MAG: NAD+ synthase [Parvibaculales bacterium]
MTNTLKIALAQLNPIVGDIAGNQDKLTRAHQQASQEGADVLVAGELYLSGYPPEDLVRKTSFLQKIKQAAQELVMLTQNGPAMIFGLPWLDEAKDKLFNSVLLAENGQMHLRHKVHLPNYAVFDEKRLFDAGPLPEPVSAFGIKIGLPICEDVWFDDVAAHLKTQGAELFISPNGSPFERGKHEQRCAHVAKRCADTGLPLIYVNQIGGQDELVFDGRSFVMLPSNDQNPYIPITLPAWQEHVQFTEWQKTEQGWVCLNDNQADTPEEMELIYQAAVLGLRDYVEKNRFPGVLLGLSGGIDSAICAAIAVDALGHERVQCIMMPSKYTSQSSLDDAADCATKLGVRLDTISIENMVTAFSDKLAPLFAGRDVDITEENIQSRIRGTLLMAVSNKFGSMVVTTGNKSEVSVGYATLYGDMNGGFNPIKDIYKMDVFALSKWRNENLPAGCLGPKGVVIPHNIIEKPPSAELRADQKDEDSLPPYEVLDAILHALVEEEMGVDDIIAQGYDAETVKRIEHLLYISEYKRRQAAPGVKIGSRNFGRDRRYPITNGFRDARFKG